MKEAITVQAVINAPAEKVWEFWTKPEHIVQWNFASDDWECPKAENDLRVNGKFKIRMSAKDESSGFEFTGTYTNIEEKRLIEYTIDDGREVRVEFISIPDGTKINETFEMENLYSEKQQREGWQAILNNFKKYAEEN